MSRWPSTKARVVFRALLRIGWTVKRQAGGSHKVLERPGSENYTWAFGDDDELGPVMLARIAKRTGVEARGLVTPVGHAPWCTGPLHHGSRWGRHDPGGTSRIWFRVRRGHARCAEQVKRSALESGPSLRALF